MARLIILKKNEKQIETKFKTAPVQIITAWFYKIDP